MKENNLIRAMSALIFEPWLLTPHMHGVLTRILVAHTTAQCDQQHAIAAGMPVNPAPKEYAVTDDGVAVIPVEGVIARKFSSMLYSSGVTSVDVLARLIDEAAADPNINAIVLNIDSPGGTVQGTREAANAVRRASEIKPVIAYADGNIHSAAYWIASQANAIYAWSEARVGSIGVYCAYLDTSRQMEMEGVKVQMFKSGSEKGAGYPGTSLTLEQERRIQESVDATGRDFRSAVRTGRARDIKDEVMQGQDFDAAGAVSVGLVDSIATFGETLRDAGNYGRTHKAKG